MASWIQRVFLSAGTVLATAAPVIGLAEEGTDSLDLTPVATVESSGWLLDSTPEGANLPVPEQQRREVRLDRIDTENFEFGAYVGLMSVEDFGVDRIQGAAFTYHVSEDFFLEGSYGTTGLGLTSYERLSGGARLIEDDQRELSHYGMSVGWTVLPGEGYLGSRWAVDTGLYLVGGVGNTNFAGENRLTVSVGGGYRIIANDFIALHLDVRDHIFDSEVLGEPTTTHNVELRTGITLFF